MKNKLTMFSLMLIAFTQACLAAKQYIFIAIDPITKAPIDAVISIQDDLGKQRSCLYVSPALGQKRACFDTIMWKLENSTQPEVVLVPIGMVVHLHAQPTDSGPPVQDYYITVRAVRINKTSSSKERTNKEISTFVNKTGGDAKALTQGQSGVASDSAGQQHIRGEHAEIAFVVDGVPLPDTLSGRQGSIVVPSTIDHLEILTGGYSPEFGGQTAAILNVTTLPGAKHSRNDFSAQNGEYDTFNSEFTAVGPLGKKMNYVFDGSYVRSANAVEPQQPDDQTAHNNGIDASLFAKLRAMPNSKDTFTLTLSHSPSQLQLNNRSGLPDSFSNGGQGYGFLGLRNADGTRPDVDSTNSGLLGAQTIQMPSQQGEGQDINQREINEFSTLAWKHQLTSHTSSQLALVLLHSGQDVTNNNPLVDVLNLPVDNSIEYNPTAIRNVHHVQITGDLLSRSGKHTIKSGILLDDQSGNESYQIIPASQLALDALFALDPSLVPPGAPNGDTDINGNPVYIPTSGITPTLRVHRVGFYRAAYLQDSWQATSHFSANYGVRADWYYQAESTSSDTVNSFEVSPRVNLSYVLNRQTSLQASYNRLFNTPPLAQGAIVGLPIEPELLDQYDISIERKLGSGQRIKAAYYYKDIRNQVDTGLLIPGSQIGLYSALNFAKGAVHGLEISYDVTPPKGTGLDGYINYSLSTAKPNGVDNTGANVPDFNDHDQRHTLGLGLAYSWKNDASAAVTLNYGSGLASSPIVSNGPRIPRMQVDFRVTTGPQFFRGKGGVGIDITNVFDSRKVINYQSAFSGTRFQQGRRILMTIFANF